jgi:hypothetical protein
VLALTDRDEYTPEFGRGRDGWRRTKVSSCEVDEELGRVGDDVGK